MTAVKRWQQQQQQQQQQAVVVVAGSMLLFELERVAATSLQRA
jgi:hypothetical protein